MGQQRNWQVIGGLADDGGEAPVFYGLDRDEVRAALVELEPIGNNVGGGFKVLPVRMKVRLGEDGPVEYATIGWRFRWESYVPTVDNAPAPEEVDRPLDDPRIAREPAPEALEPIEYEVEFETVPDPDRAEARVSFENVDPDDVTPAGAVVDHPLARE